MHQYSHNRGAEFTRGLYIKLDKEENRSREYSKGNKTVPGKVATTHTGFPWYWFRLC
jgi:hypothetical protein